MTTRKTEGKAEGKAEGPFAFSEEGSKRTVPLLFEEAKGPSLCFFPSVVS